MIRRTPSEIGRSFSRFYFRVLIRSLIYSGFFLRTYLPEELGATITHAFWLRAGEYYGGSDADARGENLENLRAMLAESDDDEELLS